VQCHRNSTFGTNPSYALNIFALTPRLAAVPYARDENVSHLSQDRVANDIAGGAEPDNDLANIGIRRHHAEIGKFLQPLDRHQYRRHCATRSAWIGLIEKGPQSRQAKKRSSDLVRHRTGQFFHRIPVRDPRLRVGKRNTLAATQEFIEPTPILGNVRARRFDN
jgi:hypothetical protein